MIAEYSQGSEVSIHGDIYSYGILILEVFNGTRPTDSIFSDNHNLRNYVQMALPDQVKRIVDPTLIAETDSIRRNNEGSAIIFDDCLISIFRIGVVCSAELPGERMNIVDVSRALRSIKNNLQRQDRT